MQNQDPDVEGAGADLNSSPGGSVALSHPDNNEELVRNEAQRRPDDH